MHENELLPQILLLLVLLISEEYYEGFKEFHEKSRDKHRSLLRRAHYHGMFKKARRLFRAAMFFLSMIILSLVINITPQLLDIAPFKMPYVGFVSTYAHKISTVVMAVVLLGLLVYALFLSFRGFIIPYKNPDEIEKEIQEQHFPKENTRTENENS